MFFIDLYKEKFWFYILLILTNYKWKLVRVKSNKTADLSKFIAGLWEELCFPIPL